MSTAPLCRRSVRPGGAAGPRARGRDVRGLAAALALATTAAAAAGALPAQAVEELDSGTFELVVNGEAVGVERFVVRHDGTMVRAAGRVTLSGEAGPFTPGEARLQLDGTYRPDRYELKPENGPLASVVGIRRANRMRVQSESEDGERVKEFLATSGLVVLERGFAHHYLLLLLMLGEDVQHATISLVVPSEGRQFRATVRDTGEESVFIGSERILARRYVIDGGGETHRVWVSADGRVLQVEVPILGWSARRRP